MGSKLLIAAFAAAVIGLPAFASAQGQVDSKGNSMGSERVGKGTAKTMAPGKTGTTTGANMRSSSSNKVSPNDSHGTKTGEKLRGQ
jgi:hypothetical protein